MLETCSIPGLERSPGEENGYPLQYFWGFPGNSGGKETACNSGDLVLIPPSVRKIPWRKEGLPTHYNILAWRIPQID